MLSAFKTREECFYESSVIFYPTTRCYIQHDSSLTVHALVICYVTGGLIVESFLA
jgi:hypothetical protein